MKTSTILISAAIIMNIMLLNACNKDEESVNKNEQIAEEDASMDELTNLIDAQMDVLTSNDDLTSNAPNLKSTSYPLITAISTGDTFWPRQITIDYGTANTAVTIGSGDYAQTLSFRGKIVVKKTGPYFAEGSTRNITFEDFHINDNAIEGNQSYSNDGLNSNDNWVFTWTSNLTLTTTEGFWIKRNVVKSRELSAGASTPTNIWDDEFIVNGTASGSNSQGWSYDNAIANVLIKRTCRFPISGTVTISTQSNTVVLNYGNGECDNLATLTDASGNSTTITLGKRWVR